MDWSNLFGSPVFAQPQRPYSIGPTPIFAAQSSGAQPAAINQPFGELSVPHYTPSQQFSNAAQDALQWLGAQPHVARHLVEGLGGVLGMTPVAVPAMAADAIDANARGDKMGAAMAMAGMLPGAKQGGRIMESIAPDIERKMVQAYNDRLPSIKKQYLDWAGENYSYDVMNRDEIESMVHPDDWHPDLRKILDHDDKVVQIGNQNEVKYFPVSEAPSLDDHMAEAVRDNGGLLPATSLSDIMSGLETRTSGAEDAASNAFRHLAESHGWSVGPGTRYMYLSRGDQRLHARISDHGNLTKTNPNAETPDINIAPGAHDFHDAAKILKSAGTNS